MHDETPSSPPAHQPGTQAAPAGAKADPPPLDAPPRTGFAFAPMGVRPGPLAAMEHLLKNPGGMAYELGGANRGLALRSTVVVALGCLLAYGLIVGLYSGGIQLVAAPLKITLGMLAAALICFPSLFIFTCLSGAEVKISEMAGLMVGALALTGLLMIGFAPVAWVFTVSTGALGFMGFLHLAFWLVGAWFGLRFLMRSLGRRDRINKEYLVVWAVVFMLVVLQMTAALRPLIGESDTLFPSEKKFFLAHWAEVLGP